MRFLQPVRMADENQGPSWARSRRRKRRGPNFAPLIGFLVTLLALFGALTAVMSIKERSIEAGGKVIDGWIATGIAVIKESAGQAPAKVEAVADKAGDKVEAAAEKTGSALKAGADKTAEEFKSQ